MKLLGVIIFAAFASIVASDGKINDYFWILFVFASIGSFVGFSLGFSMGEGTGQQKAYDRIKENKELMEKANPAKE